MGIFPYDLSSVTVDVIGDHGFFQPSEVKRLEQRQHSFSVVESPTHVCVRHDINAVADGVADGADQCNIPLHASGAVGGSPSETKLHGLVALVLVALRFRRKFAEFHAVEARSINRYARFRSAAK